MTDQKSMGSPSPQSGEGEAFSKSLEDIDTILLLGSGALKIGEAGEFDYSGSQCLKAFKEEGNGVVLIIQILPINRTSGRLPAGVFFELVNLELGEGIIEKGNPVAMALPFVGQTA